MKYSIQITCPACGSKSVNRSQRRGIEVLTKVIDIYKPFRCRRCGHRFWVWSALEHNPDRGVEVKTDVNEEEDSAG